MCTRVSFDANPRLNENHTPSGPAVTRGGFWIALPTSGRTTLGPPYGSLTHQRTDAPQHCNTRHCVRGANTAPTTLPIPPPPLPPPSSPSAGRFGRSVAAATSATAADAAATAADAVDADTDTATTTTATTAITTNTTAAVQATR